MDTFLVCNVVEDIRIVPIKFGYCAVIGFRGDVV
jgi:hypothetical protein